MRTISRFAVAGMLAINAFLVVPASAQTTTTVVDNAQYVSATLPGKSTFTTGESITMSVTVKNTGSSIWDGSYSLWPYPGTVEQYAWTTNSGLSLPRSSVNPGEEATFNLSFRAPQTPQTVAMQWRMAKDMPANVNGADQSKFFGDPLPSASISMSNVIQLTNTFKINSVTVSKQDGAQRFAEDVRTFKIVFSSPAKSIDLMISKKNPQEFFFLDQFADGTTSTIEMFPGRWTKKLEPNTTYTYSVSANAATTVTGNQSDVYIGEFTTSNFTPTVTRPPTPRFDRAEFTGRYINATQPEMKIEFGVSATDVDYFRLHWVSAENRHVDTWYRIEGSARSFTGAFDPGRNQIELIAYKNSGDANVQEDDITSEGVARMTVTAPTPQLPQDDSLLVISSFPQKTTFAPGEVTGGSLGFKNTGTNSWRPGQVYLYPWPLTSGDNRAWQNGGTVGRPLLAEVMPGVSVSFDLGGNLALNAPQSAGTYLLQWRLYRKPDANRDELVPFGAIAPSTPLQWTVASSTTSTLDAQHVGGRLPIKTTFTSGEAFDIGLTVRNTGTSRWKDDIFLHPLNDETKRWMYPVGSVSVINEVSPGAETIFVVPLKAPPASGSASTLAWQMMRHTSRVEENGQVRQTQTPFGGPIPSSPLVWTVASAPTEKNNPPVIKGITAPSLLKVGQTGTWTVKAYDPESKPLSYYVTWGDEVPQSAQPAKVSAPSYQQSQTATFTHSYDQPGLYEPRFTVIDSVDQKADTTASVTVVNPTDAPPPALVCPPNCPTPGPTVINDESEKLRERIKQLEYKISELENKVVELEKREFTRTNNSLIGRIKGRVVLQVEENGEAWYVDPATYKKYYLKDGASAYTALGAFGLGVRNQDLEKIPVGVETRFQLKDSDGDGLDDKLEIGLGTDPKKNDTDGDGHRDGDEVKNGYDPLSANKLTTDSTLVSRLKGRIVLQVENGGQAWYINPTDGKRYYMADGALAYQVMRYLSLGVNNGDLRQIPVGDFQ